MNIRNIIYDGLTILGAMSGKKPLSGPRIVQLNISDNCNINCTMCNRSCFNPKGFMPSIRIRSLIKELYSLGTQEIYFHGFGEPFLHPEIVDILNYTGKKYPKLRQFIVTNGTCISESAIQAVLMHKVRLRISLHAFDSLSWQKIHPHDNIDLFLKAKNTIKTISRKNPSLIELLFVLNHINYNQTDEMLKFSEKIGVKTVSLRPIRLMKDRQGINMNADQMLSADQYNETCRHVKHLKKRYENSLKINITPFVNYQYDNLTKAPSSWEFFQKNNCYIGYVLSVILTNGDVIGCLEESFKGTMGNIFTNAFKDIWKSKSYMEFRKQQLFNRNVELKNSGCHLYCQHMGINKKINCIKNLDITSIKK